MIDVAALHAKIARLAGLAHTDFDPLQMLTALCDAARSSMDVDGVGVMASNGLRTRFVETDHPDLVPLEKLQEALQQGPCRDSIDQGRPVVIADLRAADLQVRWPEFTATAHGVGMRSVLAVPLLARGRAWGTLDVYRRRWGPWSAAEVQAAELLADVAVSYLVLASDRDAARVLEQQLARRSLHDDLTGLPNRTLFTDRLEQALHAAHRHGTAVAVLFLDLDRFKHVNDTYGHAAGDLVLVEAARRMNAVMREDDTLARLAGDEFVAVCVDLPTTDPEVLDDLLTTVTDRLRGALGAAVRVDGVDLVVSASIGVTVVPGSVEATVGELLRAADGAMYAAKDAGRDRVHRTSPPRHRDTVQRSVGAAAGTGLARDLMHALDRGEFRVHYQPVVDSGTRRVRAVEALVRWQHPHLGLLPASDFIDLADHSGRLPALGHWVLRQACLDLADWREAVGGLAPERVFCNLSAAELLDPRLHEVISDALSAARLLPRDLGLEIVEDDLSGSDLTHALELLHTAGHPLSIDDFGTGYSSLSRLVSLPVSIAKIDRSFVAGLPQDHRSRALVDAVVVVAHSLGLEVIAEGVETIDQAAELTKAGCEYQQGYHESPPLSAEDLLRVLREPAR